MVPVYQVAYVWRNRRGFYYIYGHDHLVHFPDYPQKVCCGHILLHILQLHKKMKAIEVKKNETEALFSSCPR